MHIECLKYFYDVVQMKSISKVANASHISQPALSQQIQKLEESLGHRLLNRSNKGVELTSSGKVVLKYAENLLENYDNMLEDLKALNKHHNIRVSSCYIIATYALPCAIYQLTQKFPDCRYILNAYSSDKVESEVENEVCDLGFIYGRPNLESLMGFKIATDNLVVVAAQKYNINNEICLEDLLKHSLIMFGDEFKVKKKLNDYFLNSGNASFIENVFNVDSYESVKSVVLKGYGIAFLPYMSVKKELFTEQLKAVNIIDNLKWEREFEIYGIYKKNKELNPAVLESIKYMHNEGKKSFC
ncbi:MAG: LysR family transcriptional regulator [Dehalobacterium sp.]